MLATVVSAALICAGALLVGQLALRLCGAREWSWSAPAAGMAVLMLVSMPALHVPGRTKTTAVVLLLLLIAGIVLAVREPAQRPPWRGVLAGLPVALLVLVPFVGVWRAGTLGVSFNNDMATHLAWAEGFQSSLVAKVNLLADDYPLGPHALVGALASGLGVRVDAPFAGLTIAVPILLGWSALGALRTTGLLRSAGLVLLVGLPFFVAGFYGQGSFKELLQALFMLALVVLLTRPLLPTRWRWVPLGLMLAGSLSVYSVQGMAWGVPVIAVWLAGSLAIDRRRTGSFTHAVAVLRENVVPVLAGAGVVLVLLLPQLPRLAKFLSATASNGTGIDSSSLGNLAGRIDVWPAFGIWDRPDYRIGPIDPFVNGMWTAFALGLVILGGVLCVRRGQWILPAAAALFLLIWLYVDGSQSPYVAAKAIVVLSPVLLLVAGLPLLDRDPPGLPGLPAARWWHVAAPLLAVVLIVKVGQSSWHALRISNVGATAHADELRSLRPQLLGQRVLFLGNDDFVRWELAGVDVNGPVIAYQTMPTRPEKPWQYAHPLDFDSVPPALYNTFGWVIAPRDAAGSTPPAGLRLVRRTPTFDLYRRVATVPPRSVLAEGDAPAAVLDCTTPEGRAVLAAGGTAYVREAPVTVALPPAMNPGTTVAAPLPLTPGTWDLELPYFSPRPLVVRAAGRRFTLPPSMDRPGVRLPVGSITVDSWGDTPVTVTEAKGRFTPKAAIAYPTSVSATRRGTGREVPVREACGRYVDWYRPAAG